VGESQPGRVAGAPISCEWVLRWLKAVSLLCYRPDSFCFCFAVFVSSCLSTSWCSGTLIVRVFVVWFVTPGFHRPHLLARPRGGVPYLSFWFHHSRPYPSIFHCWLMSSHDGSPSLWCKVGCMRPFEVCVLGSLLDGSSQLLYASYLLIRQSLGGGSGSWG